MNTGQWICLIVVIIGELAHWIPTTTTEETTEEQKTFAYTNYKLHMIVYAIMFLAFTIMKVGGK